MYDTPMSKVSAKKIQQGLAEIIYNPPGHICSTAKEAQYNESNFTDAQVMWDALIDGGFAPEALQEHLKAPKTNLVTMGRLIGSKAVYDRDFIILKKDRHLQGKAPIFYYYDADTMVYVWTKEMTYAVFTVQQGGTQIGSPEIVKKKLGAIEPDRFGWFAQTVLTEESIKEGGFGPRGWLEVYDWAIRPDMKVPDLSAFHPQLSLF